MVSPSAGSATEVDPVAFQGWLWNPSRNLKVLGAAVGDEDFSAALVRKRRGKVAKLLAHICELNDTQSSNENTSGRRKPTWTASKVP